VGDLVKVNNFTGTIEKIGLRSTRIRTQDKTYITVPNKQMVDTIVDNISLRSERKIEMDIQLSVQTSAPLISALSSHVRLMIAQESNIISSSVFVAEAGKQSHVIHVECFISMQVDINSLQQLREKLNVAVIEFANQHQIQFSDKG